MSGFSVTEASGTPIAWESRGSGDAVLLVMGRAYPRAMWHRVVPTLSTSHRVIWFDNRGVGDSVPLRSDVTIPAMAADAMAVLDAAGVERAHVYGVSMGGLTAQEIAFAYPSRVRSLILGCTGALPDDTAQVGRRAGPVVRALGRLPYSLQARIAVRFSYGPHPPKDKVAEDLAILRAKPTSRATLEAQGAGINAYRSRDRVGSIRVPTLVLHGEADRTVPVTHGRDLADLIPDAKLITYPGAGHNYLTDATDQANADVLAFLAAAGTDGS